MGNELVREEVKMHWQQLRGMTYDLLDVLQEDDLKKKLPFPASQALGYQFWCMLGTQESWISLLTTGAWEDWTCSLDQVVDHPITVETIRSHFHDADQQLANALDAGNLLRDLGDGKTPLMNYMVLVEHESHHQGQLINFIYAHHLPIPPSWQEKWALSR